ncbi:hypothetical protein ACTMU2_35785 (plasmid) [Cupriavidus basilensis]|uniref:hypothetical protein n=1 Tax=unclassified Cupriavidus TaxID=2640874 RepID=UPI0010F45F75|nr:MULTISPECIES: hypothetical protein [unclassified Cupriavidus]MWL92083.1 hypothetical protein [Cupriavidus sp. SW-Y-13]
MTIFTLFPNWPEFAYVVIGGALLALGLPFGGFHGWSQKQWSLATAIAATCIGTAVPTMATVSAIGNPDALPGVFAFWSLVAAMSAVLGGR